MRDIRTDHHGPATKELLALAAASSRPCTLNFAASEPAALHLLKGLTDQNISQNRRVRMPHDAQALHAALWLLFDYMTESHDISQAIATPSGSYWHAILHRREPDASNAKYWFARVGEHPVFPELLKDAQEIVAAAGPAAAALAKVQSLQAWDAPWFTDRCVEAGAAETPVLLAIQRREWHLLFESNFAKAFA